MITQEHIQAKDFRVFNVESVCKLANEIKACGVEVQSHWPIQSWEAHPVVSQYLDELKDRDIAAAIDLANA